MTKLLQTPRSRETRARAKVKARGPPECVGSAVLETTSSEIVLKDSRAAKTAKAGKARAYKFLPLQPGAPGGPQSGLGPQRINGGPGCRNIARVRARARMARAPRVTVREMSKWVPRATWVTTTGITTTATILCIQAYLQETLEPSTSFPRIPPQT